MCMTQPPSTPHRRRGRGEEHSPGASRPLVEVGVGDHLVEDQLRRVLDRDLRLAAVEPDPAGDADLPAEEGLLGSLVEPGSLYGEPARIPIGVPFG